MAMKRSFSAILWQGISLLIIFEKMVAILSADFDDFEFDQSGRDLNFSDVANNTT